VTTAALQWAMWSLENSEGMAGASLEQQLEFAKLRARETLPSVDSFGYNKDSKDNTAAWAWGNKAWVFLCKRASQCVLVLTLR
jgi:hypothetical protein